LLLIRERGEDDRVRPISDCGTDGLVLRWVKFIVVELREGRGQQTVGIKEVEQSSVDDVKKRGLLSLISWGKKKEVLSEIVGSEI